MMTVLFLAMLLAVAWSESTAYIARSVGYRSTAGMWSGVFGFPGIVIAGWLAALLGPTLTPAAQRVVMFLVNWIFYFTVIQGALQIKRRLFRGAAPTRETP